MYYRLKFTSNICLLVQCCLPVLVESRDVDARRILMVQTVHIRHLECSLGSELDEGCEPHESEPGEHRRRHFRTWPLGT